MTLRLLATARRPLALALLLAVAGPFGAGAPAVRADDSCPPPCPPCPPETETPAGVPSSSDGEARTLPSLAVARRLQTSFVRVELTLRFDEGDEPTALDAGQGLVRYIRDERPMDLPGLVLASDRVLISDPELPGRFIESIAIVEGDRRIAAKPFARLATQDAMILALEAPLSASTPLVFDRTRTPPYRAVYFGQQGDVWKTTVGSTLESLSVDEEGRVRGSTWAPAVVVDATGTPVGVTLSQTGAIDGSDWKGSPADRPVLGVEAHDALLASGIARSATGLPRVHVRLRSPKAAASGGNFRFRSRGNDNAEGNDTERNAIGLLVSPTKIVVLAALDAATTARIEGIDVHGADGTAVPAKFVASYRYVGAFLAECESPMPGPLTLSMTPVRGHEGHLLLDVLIELQGERRRTHASSIRIDGFRQGWRRQWSPQVSGEEEGHFVFDRAGALVAFPVSRRGGDESRRYGGSDSNLMSPEYLAPMLEQPLAHADPANVPVEAEREDRLAWLGVETQRLNRDLARANGVSDQTQDGASGVLVSWVYAGSPAEKAGIKQGDVLLRIHAPDRPTPIPVGGSDDGSSSFQDYLEAMGGGFDMFGGGGGAWPSVDNALNRALTKIGIGKKIRLVYAVNGVAREVELIVEEGPAHHGSAATHKSEDVGVTVRDLTYEVRRHFQLEDSLVGVIVTKIESGGRAAVADLRRMDIVLRVGDEPVPDAAAFARAIEGGGALKLVVKDKLKERIVQIAPGADAGR